MWFEDANLRREAGTAACGQKAAVDDKRQDVVQMDAL
jgi:hypothetical protein